MDREKDVEDVRAAFNAGKAIGMSPEGDASECTFGIGMLREAWMDGLMMGRIEAHFLMSRETPNHD